MKLGVEIFFFKIPIGRTVFIFSCKTSSFVGGFSFFWSFFCHFFMQNFSFLRGWMVFLSKKRHFFSCKTSAFAGLGGLFGNFFGTFVSFFLFNPGRAREARER